MSSNGFSEGPASKAVPQQPSGFAQLNLRGAECRSLSHCEDAVLFPLPTRTTGVHRLELEPSTQNHHLPISTHPGLLEPTFLTP